MLFISIVILLYKGEGQQQLVDLLLQPNHHLSILHIMAPLLVASNQNKPSTMPSDTGLAMLDRSAR